MTRFRKVENMSLVEEMIKVKVCPFCGFLLKQRSLSINSYCYQCRTNFEIEDGSWDCICYYYPGWIGQMLRFSICSDDKSVYCYNYSTGLTINIASGVQSLKEAVDAINSCDVHPCLAQRLGRGFPLA
jgi:hypothetical protein